MRSSGFDLICADRATLDLEWPAPAIDSTLYIFNEADIIVNAAAYTAVDDAELNEDIAHAVNDIAPGIIAQFCKKKDIPLIHISTDYVFDGHGGVPYPPSHAANPKSVYGHSKHLGEINIQASGCNYLILRTSWLYDIYHKNFVTTMLRLSQTRDKLDIVSDQFGRPTYADELARAVTLAAKKLKHDPKKYTAIYHVTDTGSVTSWADFAREIFSVARPYLEKDITIENISTAEFGARAPRPAFSALDTSSFEDTFNIQLQDWQFNLKTAIREWHAKRIRN